MVIHFRNPYELIEIPSFSFQARGLHVLSEYKSPKSFALSYPLICEYSKSDLNVIATLIT